MPGYTNPLAIPYPVDADAARDAISTIPKAAAEKTNDLLAALTGLNPGALDLDPLLGPNCVTSAEGSDAYRRAGFASIHLYMRAAGPVAAGNTIVALPIGWRPPRVVRGVFSTTGSTHAAVTLLTSGSMYCEVALATNALLWGTLVYPV